MRPFATSVEMIRSRQNARLKDLRQRLLRPGYAHASLIEDGLIAIEGEHLLQEAARSGLRIDTLFLREDRAPRNDWPSFGNPQTFTVSADAFDHACATESPQGIAALVETPRWSFDSLLRTENQRLVVLAGLQDPGNVGTIIRTAEAFAATGILLTPGSVHPWNQKVLRASAGSSFRLPVVPLETIELLRRLQDERIPLYACAALNGDSIFEANLSGPLAFVIGNEGSGIPDDVLQFCSSSLHIPCPGPVESLNAGVAAAILLYEASRQCGHASIQGKRRAHKP
jgi:TrmH family RNA methyltransferase